MHDGITLEKAGLPTAVICTEPFIPSARAMAKIQGIPDYPYIILPHPLGSLSPGELRSHAVKVAPEVLSILLGKGWGRRFVIPGRFISVRGELVEP